MVGRKADQETVNKIREMWESGSSGYEISKKLGLTKRRVYYWINKFKKEVENNANQEEEEFNGSVGEGKEVSSDTTTKKAEKEEKEEKVEEFEELRDDVKEEEKEKEEVREWRKLILRI